MNPIAAEIIIILLLLAANGLFAMTEIAVVSARKARLRRLAETGDLKAKAALALAESNYRIQREVADARALLEASISCRSPRSAEPVLQWMALNRVESVTLQSLAMQVRAIKVPDSSKACT